MNAPNGVIILAAASCLKLNAHSITVKRLVVGGTGFLRPEISPPLGNAAEPSRPLVCFGETPMVGKLAPLPLRLMLRTSQPTGLATYVFSRVEVENV